LKRACRLQDAIREGRLAVIDMGDDAEVSDFISVGHDVYYF
jgi:hypothetical protein